jgi:hypothetical protein
MKRPLLWLALVKLGGEADWADPARVTEAAKGCCPGGADGRAAGVPDAGQPSVPPASNRSSPDG